MTTFPGRSRVGAAVALGDRPWFGEEFLYRGYFIHTLIDLVLREASAKGDVVEVEGTAKGFFTAEDAEDAEDCQLRTLFHKLCS